MREELSDASHVKRLNRWINFAICHRKNFAILPGIRHTGVSLTAPLKEIFNMNANIKKALVAVGAMVAAGSALAVDDAGVVAINGLAAQATTYITAAFAVAVLVAGGFWGIKMMKKAFSKAG